MSPTLTQNPSREGPELKHDKLFELKSLMAYDIPEVMNSCGLPDLA